MEIALLIRGQMKNWKLASVGLQKQLIDRYPQHNFKIFLHTWTTEPKNTGGIFPKSLDKYGYLQEIPQDDLEMRISKFTPTCYSISSPVEFSKLIMSICKETHYDKKFINWIRSYQGEEYRGGSNSLKFIYNPPAEKHQFQRRLIETNYMLGQYYSACKTSELLHNYTQETGWIPDIVHAIRADVLLDTSRPADASLYEDLDEVLTALKSDKNVLRFGIHRNRNALDPVIVRRITGKKSRLWFCDFNFFFSFNTSKYFLGDNADAFFKHLFVARKLELMPYLHNSEHFAHTFWSSLGYNASFVEWATFLPRQELCRSSSDKSYEELMEMPINDLVMLANSTRKQWDKTDESTKDWSHDDAVDLIIGDSMDHLKFN